MTKDNIKLICFDLNKTLINENSWLDLNLAMGVTKEEDAGLFNLWKNDVISYSQWQQQLLNIYKTKGRHSKKNILSAVSDYSYKPGAKEVIRLIKQKGYEIALISGSMDLLVEKIASELNISYFVANNTFIFDSKNFLKEIKCSDNEALGKLESLGNICTKLHINITECVCIGDGDNDIEIFKKTKHGITFRDSKITSSAWKVIDSLADLQKIL